MTAKEQKIKEAWEQIDYWRYLWSTKTQQTALKFDGYVFKTALPASFNKELFDLDFTKMCVRPKSLAGIESNNGWKRIESEADLPTEGQECIWIQIYTESQIQRTYTTEKYAAKLWTQVYTHYRVKEQFKKPIY